MPNLAQERSFTDLILAKSTERHFQTNKTEKKQLICFLEDWWTPSVHWLLSVQLYSISSAFPMSRPKVWRGGSEHAVVFELTAFSFQPWKSTDQCPSMHIRGNSQLQQSWLVNGCVCERSGPFISLNQWKLTCFFEALIQSYTDLRKQLAVPSHLTILGFFPLLHSSLSFFI